ncbi:MAG: chitobiase/beta-hexosaminidase C-terminal domain-containing protein [Eubacteriales bacterium]
MINRLLNTGLVTEGQIQSFVIDLETKLSKKMLNQNNFNDIFINTFYGAIMSNPAVRDAVMEAYSEEIDDFLGKGTVPADFAHLMADIKIIVLSSIVVASPSGGTYDCPLTVELNGYVENSAFYYTVDKSKPTTSSKKYDGAIQITGFAETIVLKVIARKDNITSDVASFYYTFSCTGNGIVRGFVYLEKSNPDDPEPEHSGTEVTVKKDGAVINEATSLPNGSYEIGTLPAGSLQIFFNHPGGGWKEEVRSVTIGEGEVVGMPDVLLRIGDMNEDGTIDIFDLLWMASKMGFTPDSPEWAQAEKADVNKDGEIDIFDLLRVAVNFSQ